MTDALFVTLTALVLAYIFSEIFKYFTLPRVIGQILAGIILGLPIIRNILFTNDVESVFSFIANIGIILLFFFIGLEINLKQFRKNIKKASFVSIFNTAIPLAAGFLFSKYLFHFNNITSLVIGISLSVSSQAISLDILDELKILKSKIGSLIIDSGAVDDVFELFLISAILVLFQETALGEVNVFKLIIGVISFILIVIIFRVSLIPLALRLFRTDKSQSTLFMGSLIIVLTLAYLSELAGIGSLIGALVAGILVRQTLISGAEREPWRRNEISHSMHMVSFGFLIPIFFVNVGLKTDFNTLSSNIFLILVLLLIDLIGTVGGTIIGVLLGKGSFNEGLILGWGVAPKGDTELVIATLALNSGLINVSVFSAIIAVALISTFIAPIIFRLLVQKRMDLIK